jgi:polyisoprenoid-binding protein YceI
MTIKSGSHQIGPENGSITINTYVGGMGSKMGHDLVLEATKWSGTVNIDADNPAASSAQVTVDVRSLEIIKATGGVKSLSDKDKVEIAANQAKTLQSDKYPEITFETTAVTGEPPTLSLLGNLTIHGKTKPISLEVKVTEGASESTLTGSTTVVQSDYGIKPYSKMGALKVKDPVDLQVTFSLPS